MVPARSGLTGRQHRPSRCPSGPSRSPSREPRPRQHFGQPDHCCTRPESRARDYDMAHQGRALAAPGARRILVLAANRGPRARPGTRGRGPRPGTRGRGPRPRPGTHSRPGTPSGARPWAHQGHGRSPRRPGLPARSCRRTRQPSGGRPVCLAEIAATLERGGNPVGPAIRGRHPAALPVLTGPVAGAHLAAGSPPAASIAACITAASITAACITAASITVTNAAAASANTVAIPAAEQARTRPPRPVSSAVARPRAHRVARAHAAPARRTSIHPAGSPFRR
jgi:hypothetical protein